MFHTDATFLTAAKLQLLFKNFNYKLVHDNIYNQERTSSNDRIQLNCKGYGNKSSISYFSIDKIDYLCFKLVYL